MPTRGSRGLKPTLVKSTRSAKKRSQAAYALRVRTRRRCEARQFLCPLCDTNGQQAATRRGRGTRWRNDDRAVKRGERAEDKWHAKPRQISNRSGMPEKPLAWRKNDRPRSNKASACWVAILGDYSKDCVDEAATWPSLPQISHIQSACTWDAEPKRIFGVGIGVPFSQAVCPTGGIHTLDFLRRAPIAVTNTDAVNGTSSGRPR